MFHKPSAYKGKLTQRTSCATQPYIVIFDPPADDVNEWFKSVGFILSPSNFESFHLDIGEVIFNGTVPVNVAGMEQRRSGAFAG